MICMIPLKVIYYVEFSLVRSEYENKPKCENK